MSRYVGWSLPGSLESRRAIRAILAMHVIRAMHVGHAMHKSSSGVKVRLYTENQLSLPDHLNNWSRRLVCSTHGGRR